MPKVAARTGAREVAELPAACRQVSVPRSRKLRLALGETPGKIAQRAARREGRLQRRGGRIDRARSTASPTELALFAERSEEIANCAQRATGRGDAARALAGRSRALRRMKPRADTAHEAAWIRWVDITQSGWQLNASPLSVADVFGKRVVRVGTRVDIHVRDARASASDFRCTSASWALRRRPPDAGIRPSTTNLRRCSACRATAAAQSRASTPRRVVAAALPVLRASGGRAFLLFTTLRALNVARDLLAAAIRRRRTATGPCSCRAKGRAASS